MQVIWGNEKAENFFVWDWTAQITLTRLAFLLSRRTTSFARSRATKQSGSRVEFEQARFKFDEIKAR